MFNNLRVFFLWVAGNLLGCGITVGLISGLPILKSTPGIVLTFFILALPTGVAQWLVLRRLIPLTVMWVFAIPVGWILFYLAMLVTPEGLWQMVDDESPGTLTFLFIVIGAAMGIPQWYILRRHFTKSAVWILGSAVGAGLGLAVIMLTGLIDQSEFISSTIAVLVYGIATGLALFGLLNHDAKIYAQKPGAV